MYDLYSDYQSNGYLDKNSHAFTHQRIRRTFQKTSANGAKKWIQKRQRAS